MGNHVIKKGLDLPITGQPKQENFRIPHHHSSRFAGSRLPHHETAHAREGGRSNEARPTAFRGSKI